MGWNSYDMTIGNHGINSSFAIQAAHFIHENLQPLGYDYLTLDSGWFGTDSVYEADGAGQTVDEYGRLVPNRTCVHHPAVKIIWCSALSLSVHCFDGIGCI